MQQLLTRNLLTYLHLLSHHSRFTHAATLVLTSPYLAYQRTFSSLDRSLATTGKHTIYFQTLPHHIVHKYSTFQDHSHIKNTFCLDDVLHKFFFHLFFHNATPAHHNTINSLQKGGFMYKFSNVSQYITSNCIRIESVLTLSSSHVIVFLTSPKLSCKHT